MRPLLAAILVWALPGSAAPEDARREDFAYGIEMQPLDDAPLYRVRVPLDVYRTVTRGDLGDLRVVNASGALVPHEIRAPDASPEKIVRELRVFPLVESSARAFAEVRVRIESGSDRAAVAITPAPSEGEPEIAEYVLDPGDIDDRYRADGLVLEWDPPRESFLRSIRVSWSQDLDTWSQATTAVVAELRRDGARLVRNEVALALHRGRYLRLESVDGPLPSIRGARLELVPAEAPVERSFEPALDVSRTESGAILFDTSGPLLVEAVDIEPRETNTWTRVTLYSRTEPDERWVRRASGSIYALVLEGGRLASTRLELTGTRDRYWKLVPETSRGGFGGSLPEIRVGYRPDELLFVARGAGPFELVYGHRRVEPIDDAAGDLSELVRGEAAIAPSEAVALGEPRPIAGDRALGEPLVADWKRVVLWSTLGLASIVLLLVARAALASTGADA